LSFTYDPWGNRLQQSLTAGYAGQSQITVDTNNRIVGTPANCSTAHAFCYDAAGNLINDTFHQYTFNGKNQIAQVDPQITNGTTTYTHDPGGDRVRKDTPGSNFTEYYRFGGNVLAEQDQAGNWSDYVYAGGKRIAKSDNFKGIITTSGTQCSNCGWQWNIFWLPGNLNNQGYVIRPGDKLLSWQWSSATARGGMNLWFTDGTNTIGTLDQDGQATDNDTVTQVWHYRRVDLSAYAGKTISNTGLVTEGFTPAGSWAISYTDMALLSSDGTVWPFYTGQSSVTLNAVGATGSTRTYAVGNQSGYGWPALSTVYYHGDQIGSSRLITNYNGYPVWRGTFLPYGEEYNAQIGTNHYKFTGKERDDESGLDYFGARYYGNALGRFASVDPLQVIKQKLLDPQQWNMYQYARDNPVRYIDPTGMYVTSCSLIDINKCDQNTQNFEKARQEALKSPDQKVRDAASAYGAYGEKNKVTVGFSNNEKSHTGFAFNQKGQYAGIHVTINANMLSGIEKSPGTAQVVLAVADVAHEGSHVKTDRELVKANFTVLLNITNRQSEIRAYGVANSVVTAAGYMYLNDNNQPVDLSNEDKINKFLNTLPPNPHEKLDDPIYKPPKL